MDNTKSSKNIVLIGNPNVGKTSLFNAITGLHQHTGNWTGKTVKCAYGDVTYNNETYTFVDLPGCYSLKPRSPEEMVARDYLYSGDADLTIVVCDATALERNLCLALQVMELTHNVIICLNLVDEAEKMNINIDTDMLSQLLNTTIIKTNAHNKSCKNIVLEAIENYVSVSPEEYFPPLVYTDEIENKIKTTKQTQNDFPYKNRIRALNEIQKLHTDAISYTISKKAKEITTQCLSKGYSDLINKQKKIDKLLTGKFFGFLSMFVLVMLVFWITLTGANYPSELLNKIFTALEHPFYNFVHGIGVPTVICEMLVYGVYHILTKIISVMLPPMAIFFPLFTLLEDIGYLPRIAFNLDKCFKKCSACGKQALTMCMGFGCNSAGVVGCRIIDSPREQLIAIITNSFIPCNGRFPAIISIIAMFFISNRLGVFSSVISSFILTLFIVIGILMSMLVSLFLSKTFLKGETSSFILELPHYRKPDLLKIITHSLFDRTLFVLLRAIKVAAPAGLIIWLCANIKIYDISILAYISNFLNPLGQLMGLDGIILAAFIFGFPANEIVIPLIFMMYMSNGVITDVNDLSNLKTILMANGWTQVTAINTILFMIMHWPCSTTCLTIKAETRSVKWTLLSIVLPTLCGIALCILINLVI